MSPLSPTPMPAIESAMTSVHMVACSGSSSTKQSGRRRASERCSLRDDLASAFSRLTVALLPPPAAAKTRTSA